MSKGEPATPSERWHAIKFNVNGESRIVNAHPMKRLLDVLREDLHLTGTKEGCGEGECGSCSVRMNGELVNSCLVPVLQAKGADIQTVEGLALDGKLHPLQKAFLEHGGAQCGICTPGMLMAAAQLLEQNPDPGIVQIREALAGNLCRCTGFIRIFESVAAAVASENARLVSESANGQLRDTRDEAPHAR
jgi:aerobic carbon-monoxide dehydrogenase small subunit